MSNYFDGLEALLQESIAEKEARKLPKPPKAVKPKESGPRSHVKNVANKSNADWMNSSERAEYYEQIQKINGTTWKTEAAVALFATQVCLSCGSQHTHFEGFFFYQTCRDQKSARWERAKDRSSLSTLPKFRKITMHDADCCSNCIHQQGYTSPHPSQSEPSHAAWTPHQGHQKYSDQLEYSGGFGSTHKI